MAICKICGLPQEVCPHGQQMGEGESVRITKDKRSYGKMVTIVSGVPSAQVDAVAKELKTKCAAGGTIKDGRIEIQGDHVAKVKKLLEGRGYNVSSS